MMLVSKKSRALMLSEIRKLNPVQFTQLFIKLSNFRKYPRNQKRNGVITIRGEDFWFYEKRDHVDVWGRMFNLSEFYRHLMGDHIIMPHLAFRRLIKTTTWIVCLNRNTYECAFSRCLDEILSSELNSSSCCGPFSALLVNYQCIFVSVSLPTSLQGNPWSDPPIE